MSCTAEHSGDGDIERRLDPRQQYEANGMRFAGTSPDGGLVEIIELPDHPWFVAVQFHPEFKSKPLVSHPLFAGFIEAAIERLSRRAENEAPIASQR